MPICPRPSSSLSLARNALVVVAAIGLVAACGTAKEQVETVSKAATAAKDSVKGHAQSLVEEADDFLNLEPMEDRRTFCAAEEGEWVEAIDVSACEEGVVTLSFQGETRRMSCTRGEGGHAEMQCLHRNDEGDVYFNDGPSVPNVMQSLSGVLADRTDLRAYNRLFWPAGVSHDYCYHHGSANEGLSRRDCDRRYFSDLRAVCVHAEDEGLDWFRPKTCRAFAAAHYMAVRSQGQSPFDVMDAKVTLPAYQPLWQLYGLPEDALDAETLAEVDGRLRQTGQDGA